MNVSEFLHNYARAIAIYGYLIPFFLSMIWMVLGIIDQLKQDIKWSYDRHNYPITKWKDVFIMIALPLVPFLNIFIVGVAIVATVQTILNKTVITNKVELDFSDYHKKD